MQDRYTGDIGDFGKLGLLRQLASTGLSIGINWYRTPDETHNSDGLHIGYLQKEQFRACDPDLWSALGRIVSSGKREITALEQCAILDAAYFGKKSYGYSVCGCFVHFDLCRLRNGARC